MSSVCNRTSNWENRAMRPRYSQLAASHSAGEEFFFLGA